MSRWQDYFMKLVDDTVETSVKHVRAFVHQYLSARLVEARSSIEEYGQRYAEAMLSALDTSKKGEQPTCVQTLLALRVTSQSSCLVCHPSKMYPSLSWKRSCDAKQSPIFTRTQKPCFYILGICCKILQARRPASRPWPLCSSIWPP